MTSISITSLFIQYQIITTSFRGFLGSTLEGRTKDPLEPWFCSRKRSKLPRLKTCRDLSLKEHSGTLLLLDLGCLSSFSLPKESYSC